MLQQTAKYANADIYWQKNNNYILRRLVNTIMATPPILEKLGWRSNPIPSESAKLMEQQNWLNMLKWVDQKRREALKRGSEIFEQSASAKQPKERRIVVPKRHRG